MNYTLTTPCSECPFLAKFAHGYTIEQLEGFASGAFHCHRTGVWEDDKAKALPDSQHCAGALIYLEKQDRSTQMMRIAERLGLYDRSKLNMEAPVREVPRG